MFLEYSKHEPNEPHGQRAAEQDDDESGTPVGHDRRRRGHPRQRQHGPEGDASENDQTADDPPHQRASQVPLASPHVARPIASSGSTAYVSEHPFGLSQLAKASRRPFPTFRRGVCLPMHLVEFGSSRSQGKGHPSDRGAFVGGKRFIGLGLPAGALDLPLNGSFCHREIHSSPPSCRYFQPSSRSRRARRRRQTRSHRAALASLVTGTLSIRSSISWSGRPASTIRSTSALISFKRNPSPGLLNSLLQGLYPAALRINERPED